MTKFCISSRHRVMCADRSRKWLVSALTGLDRHVGGKQFELCDWGWWAMRCRTMKSVFNTQTSETPWISDTDRTEKRVTLWRMISHRHLMGYLLASEDDDNDLKNRQHCMRTDLVSDSILDARVNIIVTICTGTILIGGKSSQRTIVSGRRKLGDKSSIFTHVNQNCPYFPILHTDWSNQNSQKRKFVVEESLTHEITRRSSRWRESHIWIHKT